MTSLNRALLRAYERHADELTASQLEQHHSAVIRGWARKLRSPARPSSQEQSPGRPERQDEKPPPSQELQGSAQQSSLEQKSQQAVVSVHRPDGTTLRFDQAHAASRAERPIAPEAAPTAPETPKRANWAWPSIVERLLSCPAAGDLRGSADRLHDLAAHCDLRCLALGGSSRRAGTTSLILTLAWILSEEKSSRVAIVDANLEHPGLAQSLSFRPESGLDRLLREDRGDLDEMTTDLSEHLAIAPLLEPISAKPLGREGLGALQSLLRSLRMEFDLVLVDAGTWAEAAPPAVLECRAIDAFVGITRSGGLAAARINGPSLQQLGIDWLGQIETFVPARHA